MRRIAKRPRRDPSRTKTPRTSSPSTLTQSARYPVCPSMLSVAPESITTMQIYKGVIPFVGIQVVALFLVAAFPELTTWLPKVVFGP